MSKVQSNQVKQENKKRINKSLNQMTKQNILSEIDKRIQQKFDVLKNNDEKLQKNSEYHQIKQNSLQINKIKQQQQDKIDQTEQNNNILKNQQIDILQNANSLTTNNNPQQSTITLYRSIQDEIEQSLPKLEMFESLCSISQSTQNKQQQIINELTENKQLNSFEDDSKNQTKNIMKTENIECAIQKPEEEQCTFSQLIIHSNKKQIKYKNTQNLNTLQNGKDLILSGKNNDEGIVQILQVESKIISRVKKQDQEYQNQKQMSHMVRANNILQENNKLSDILNNDYQTQQCTENRQVNLEVACSRFLKASKAQLPLNDFLEEYQLK